MAETDVSPSEMHETVAETDFSPSETHETVAEMDVSLTEMYETMAEIDVSHSETHETEVEIHVSAVGMNETQVGMHVYLKIILITQPTFFTTSLSFCCGAFKNTLKPKEMNLNLFSRIFQKLLIVVFLLGILSACDNYEDDAVLIEEPLELQDSYTALPNTSLMIDLANSLNTTEAIRVIESVAPKKGDLVFMSQGLALYEPHDTFKSGSDSFTIDIVSEDSTQVIDSETVTVIMGSSEDDLPCFNGALTDELKVEMNKSGTINVIGNDGYCEGETSGAIVNLDSEPLNGSTVLGDLFEFVYTPDSGFIGRDDFIYALTLVDKEGNEYNSRGLVIVNVLENVTSTCDEVIADSLFVDYNQLIQNDGVIGFSPVISCDSSRITIQDINSELLFGEFELNADEIRYTPFNPDESFEENISYTYTIGDREALYAGELLIIYDALGGTCTALPEAADDYFEIDLAICDDTDSAACSELAIFNNDFFCSNISALRINITAQPTSGFVSAGIDTTNVDNYFLKLYYTEAAIPPPEEGDELEYEICDGTNCSSAKVFIKYLSDGNANDEFINVSGNIDEDQTWTADKIVRLYGQVFVTPGNTLTIEPGTIIKGMAGQGSEASYLIISNGATIEANGTFDEPIVMTSEFDNIDVGQKFGSNLSKSDVGLWGGLIILGNAPVSTEFPEDAKIEGLPADEEMAYYGGNDPQDNSGSLKYVSIRHAGSNIGAGNELNCLTLAGVGSATMIESIEVYASENDGIQFYGGNVEVKNVVAAYNLDDALDSDQGWYGSCENFVAYNFGSHALEMDGPEGDDFFGDHSFSGGSIYTVIGNSDILDYDDNSNVSLESLYIILDSARTNIVDEYHGQPISNIEVTLLYEASLSEVFNSEPVDFPLDEIREVELGENSVGGDETDQSWNWTITYQSNPF